MQKEDFTSMLRLCALGARICYSSQDIDELLNDNRVNGDGVIKYLENIFKMGHFSVFSHAFKYYYKIDPPNKFKSVVTKNSVGLSARHFLEEQQQFPYDTSDLLNLNKIEIIKQTINENIIASLLYKSKEEDGWAVIHVDGISRITSHQLVRYSSLNFSQRSQRYCSEKNNKFLLPNNDYINDANIAIKSKQLFEQSYSSSMDIYNKLIEMGVRKEDARYVLPQAMNTSLLMSGTIKQINHFITQRKEKFAQDEIRKLAIAVEEVLN
jgi:flavin-dependent thymidylate synthase